MAQFKPNLLTVALATAGLITMTPSWSVYAQQAEQAEEQVTEESDASVDEEMEVIEVTGFRRSLIQSINDKRFGDTVAEHLSADDLGALPDVSMADALTRLPGISAVRTGGQASEINIRGMSGGFVFTTLNGREQMSTSGKRSIEFDQYPSELISSAAVYKSPKASLIEGGVAGSVELRTASPLSLDQDHSFVANARGMYNDRASEVYGAEEYGHRLSFSYQGKYLDNTLGVAAGYARLYQPSVSTQFIGLQYPDRSAEGQWPDYTDDGVLVYSEGMELQHKGGEETRDGFMGVLEWEPNDVLKVKADGFYSKFDSEAFARGFRVKFGGSGAQYYNPVVAGDKVIGGTIVRDADSSAWTRVEIVNDDNTEVDEITSLGLNLELQATDNLLISLDVGYSKAESDFRNGLLWSLVAEDANAATPVFDTNVQINYQLNGLNLPDVGFNQADAFSDINRTMLSKYGIYPYYNTDEQDSYRLDFKYELDNDFLSSVEWGLRYSDRTYLNKRSVFEYGDDGAFSTTEGPLQLTSDMVNVVNWEGDFGHFPSYLAIDQSMALNAWFPNGVPQPVMTWGDGNDDVINSPGGTRNTSWSVLQSGEVYETVMAGFVMANVDTEMFDIPVTGNIGVRIVDTDQSATSIEDVGGDVELGAQCITDDAGLINCQYAPGTQGIRYTDYLPQMNLNFHITDNQQIRFAAAKVMARPDIERLASQVSYNISDDGVISGESKNSPYLKPFYANQFDISYEHYFSDTDGAFIAAIFYKDIESKIETASISNYDFAGNGWNVPEYVVDPDSGALIPTTNGTYTTAVNVDDAGYLQGIELAYTQVFSFLPEPFSGLGVNASYSYTDSEIETTIETSGDPQIIPLEGLSENVFTGTLFYQYKGLDSRISARYRDEFVSDQVAVDSQTVNYDEELVVDFQTSYAFDDHLSVLFQVNNVTDEPTKSYFFQEAQTGTIQYFGREYFLGVTYKL